MDIAAFIKKNAELVFTAYIARAGRMIWVMADTTFGEYSQLTTSHVSARSVIKNRVACFEMFPLFV